MSGTTTPNSACQATPRKELLRRLLDPNTPKSEREWCAAREIENMRVDISDACVTLTDCIGECEGFSDPNTANKLCEVRKTLLSYLPNTI